MRKQIGSFEEKNSEEKMFVLDEYKNLSAIIDLLKKNEIKALKINSAFVNDRFREDKDNVDQIKKGLKFLIEALTLSRQLKKLIIFINSNNLRIFADFFNTDLLIEAIQKNSAIMELEIYAGDVMLMDHHMIALLQCSHLKALSLRPEALQKKRNMITAISLNKTLESLSLEFLFEELDEMDREILSTLKWNNTLKHLGLHFSGLITQEIAENLLMMKSLKSLDLSGSRVHLEAIKTIANSTKLTALKFDYENFDYPAIFSKNISLRTIQCVGKRAIHLAALTSAIVDKDKFAEVFIKIKELLVDEGHAKLQKALAKIAEENRDRQFSLKLGLKVAYTQCAVESKMLALLDANFARYELADKISSMLGHVSLNSDADINPENYQWFLDEKDRPAISLKSTIAAPPARSLPKQPESPAIKKDSGLEAGFERSSVKVVKFDDLDRAVRALASDTLNELILFDLQDSDSSSALFPDAKLTQKIGDLLVAISNCNSLKKLRLNYSREIFEGFYDNLLKAIEKNNSIKFIEINISDLANRQLMLLLLCTHLEEISLQCHPAHMVLLGAIASNPAIKSLSLPYVGIITQKMYPLEIAELFRVSFSLRHLAFSSQRDEMSQCVTDEEIKNILKIPRLESLDLQERFLGVQALKTLASSPKLKKLAFKQPDRLRMRNYAEILSKNTSLLDIEFTGPNADEMEKIAQRNRRQNLEAEKVVGERKDFLPSPLSINSSQSGNMNLLFKKCRSISPPEEGDAPEPPQKKSRNEEPENSLLSNFSRQ